MSALQTVLLKHASDAFRSAGHLASEWKALGYAACPDIDAAVKEYERFAELLSSTGARIEYLPGDSAGTADSIYIRDTAVAVNDGVIVGRMGKTARRNEPVAVERYLGDIGVRIVGRVSGTGTLEGGDVVRLDERTFVVGRGYRTNDEGIRQFRSLVSGMVEEVIVVDLPHWEGPSEVLHLMSLLSPVDTDLAVTYSKLLPVSFIERLRDRGVELVEVCDEEFASMACNVLTLAPRSCLMISGNPRARKMLEAAGAKVTEYNGKEISRKGSGGPTCLTLPLLREYDDDNR
ncbi:MAG: dimethylarginine dimethylaminohydrolase family protein [Gemmatimonadaceae bacterium]